MPPRKKITVKKFTTTHKAVTLCIALIVSGASYYQWMEKNFMTRKEGEELKTQFKEHVTKFWEKRRELQGEINQLKQRH